METYIEQYQAKQGGVTLHTWTEVQGGKKDNYITGVSGTPVASWFRRCSARSTSPISPTFPILHRVFMPKALRGEEEAAPCTQGENGQQRSPTP